MRKLVILLLVLAGIALVCSDSAYASAGLQAGSSQCDPPVYYGIQHCVEADKAAQVIVVDLNDPHIRFKTVLPKNAVGQECNSVNPSSLDPASNCPYPYPFEKLTDMLARYKATGAVAIINTDYFGCAGNSEYPCGSPAGFHGAQGLAVRDGERLDGPQHAVDNSLATEQPSLMISPSRIARIGFPESAAAIEAHASSLFFNTVAGAPLIVQQGQTVNDRCTRPYPGDTCATQSQSAGGLTNDGRLVLITARMNSAGIARQLVIQHGVHTAIKFDGGGSARMAWVDANGVIETFSGRMRIVPWPKACSSFPSRSAPTNRPKRVRQCLPLRSP